MNKQRANELKELLDHILSIRGYVTKIYVADWLLDNEDPDKQKSVDIKVKCCRQSDIKATCNLIDSLATLSGHCSNSTILANGEADHILDVIGSIW